MATSVVKQENCKIRLKFASGGMANGLKTMTQPTKPMANMDEFKELFAALFKVKDWALQARIMKAINNMPEKCPNCSYNLLELKKQPPKSVQPVAGGNPVNGTHSNKVNPSPSANIKQLKSTNSCGTQTMPLDAYEKQPKLNITISDVVIPAGMQSKMRFRRARLPHVIKHTTQLQNVPNSDDAKTPIISDKDVSFGVKLPASTYLQLEDRTDIVPNAIKCEQLEEKSSVPQSLDFDDFLTDSDLSEIGLGGIESLMAPFVWDTGILEPPGFSVVREMRMEWMYALLPDTETGLYPIHVAALDGDINRLRRQVIIFGARKLDIDIKSLEIPKYSDAQADFPKNTPLHCSLLAPKPQIVVRHLLDHKARVMETNDDGDTVLHYAIKHLKELQVFRMLLAQVTFKDLAYENDVGMSLLHLAVNEKKFMFARAIMQHIDDCLQIKSVDYNVWDEDRLIEMYKSYVGTFIRQESPKVELNRQKMELINHRERKGGRTPLFLATMLESEPLVYMLLAHLADPRIIDMSEVTCSFFSSDLISNRKLSAAIYNAEYLYKYRIEPLRKGTLPIVDLRKRKAPQRASTIVAKVSKLNESLDTFCDLLM